MKNLLLITLLCTNIALAQSYQYLGSYDSMGTPQYLENPGDIIDTAILDLVRNSLPESYPCLLYTSPSPRDRG